MTFDQYNALTSEDKVNFQWQVRRKHLSTSNLGSSEYLWNKLYGHKRFMVNSKNLWEKDRWIFESEDLLVVSMDLEIHSQMETPDVSPILNDREKFERATEVIIKNYIKNQRFYWLHEPLVEGEHFELTRDDYNICSPWGVLVRIEKEGWEKGGYELPMRELIPI